MLQFMLAPFVACMVLVAIHSYLGLHVIAREVIFVDLSLAQMAALGSVVALLYGVAPDSHTAFVFSLVFTCIGAALFALTRTRGKGRVPHEAIIGIVYVVASAAAILVADRAPRGAEAIHDVLEGAIIWITWPTIIQKGAAYAALGLLHFFLRKQFLKISFHADAAEREGWNIRFWDFLFYVSFGVAVTMSVPVAGVLLVFTMLVVPAVVAFLFSRDIRKMVLISWGAGALASLLGLYVSYVGNFPTGPCIVCMYGLVLVAAGALRRLGVGEQNGTGEVQA
ncbi:MAG TPA: metal ABC transporter permease [Gemmatimonadales bacterium]|nr:metal ABC transporter permease [Gemmatimonadales bacterium]